MRFAIRVSVFFSITILFSWLAGAQKSNNLQEKATELLKKYQPPLLKIESPKESPKEAWDKLYIKPAYGENNSFLSKKTIHPESYKFHKGKKAVYNDDGSYVPQSKPTKEEMKARIDEYIAKSQNKIAIRSGNSIANDKEVQKLVEEGAKGRRRSDQPNLTTEELRKEFEKMKERNPSIKIPQGEQGITGTAKISGVVYNDLIHNYIRDTNDVGLSGWMVILYNYYQNTYDTVYTAVDGTYSFTSLEAGYYYPFIENREGWYLTQNLGGTYYYFYDGDSLTNVNFGEWEIPYRAISGFVYEDINRNGMKDENEAGLEGWTVDLDEYYSENTYSMLSDSVGYFQFDSLHKVTSYVLTSESRYRWLNTEPSYYNSYSLFLFDSSETNNNFGKVFLPPFLISGVKFSDDNGNGVRDEGEAGLPEWTIYIYNNSLYTEDTVYTDSLGQYTFVDSGDAAYFSVYEQNQSGWYNTKPGGGSPYYSLYIAGDTSQNIDFGNWLVPPSAIYGKVFNDLNSNGVQDEGEPPMPGWNITMLRIRNTSDGDGGGGDTRFAGISAGVSAETLKTVTDENGNYAFENLTFVAYYYIFQEARYDWNQTAPGGIWSFSLAGDTITYANFGNNIIPQPPIRVNVMPSNAKSPTYGNALVGVPLTVWGNVHGGYSYLHYALDYGDGTIDSGETLNGHFIGNEHSYLTAGPKTMSLTVWDDSGQIDMDEAVVRVFAVPTQQIRTNMAIEKGLLYLYLQQYPEGYWYDNSNNIPSTGAAVLSFEENGHKKENDFNSDIYAEYIQMGMNFLLGKIQTYPIYTQPAGNPDTDNDGFGAYISSDTYVNGIANLAIIGSHSSGNEAKMDTIRVGVYAGQTMYDYVVDMVDQWAFSQTDGSTGRGGWRYSVYTDSYGSQDNSTTQWASLDLEAAQNGWGVPVPPFVKSELLISLQYTQGGDGGFGYDAANYWENITKTAAGIGSYAFLDATTDTPAVANGLVFIDNQWNFTGTDSYGWDQHLSGNTYGMYGVAKGMRIINHRAGHQFIGSHDWYAEYVSHLLDNPTWKQNGDGSWPRSNNYPGYSMSVVLNSSFAILVLTRGVVVPPPVANITSISGHHTNTSFQVDGSGSFHQDPEKSIIEYLWDWDLSNGIDWDNPDGYGEKPVNPGYADTGTYTITLRVRDNSEPNLTAIATTIVHIQNDQNPPVAVPIPPDRGPSYAAKVNEPILLDGRASYDPDYPLDSVVAYNWDLNGDSQYGDSFADTVTVSFADEHQGQVGLRVYDSRGDSSTNIAYISVVASRKDVFVQSFTALSEGNFPSGTVTFKAVLMNDFESNANVNHVLVRFYDENPFTTGNIVGGNYYVDLAIGESDTIEETIELPEGLLRHARHYYVFLDANNQQAEWNEINNVLSANTDIAFFGFSADPSELFLDDTLHLKAFVQNSVEGAYGISHLQVRFYKDSIFSAGNQIGCDKYVNLPVGGMDSVMLDYVIPYNEMTAGKWNFYAVVDPDNYVVEDDETNNSIVTSVVVTIPPSEISLDRECINFATVDSGGIATIPFPIENHGRGTLVIDSIVISDTTSFHVAGFCPRIKFDSLLNLEVSFTPAMRGWIEGSMTLYTNDGEVIVNLMGQGELLSLEGIQQFTGQVRVNNFNPPNYSVIGAYRKNGELIRSELILNSEARKAEGGYIYFLTVRNGQAGLAPGDTIFFKVWSPDCSEYLEEYCDRITQFTIQLDSVPTDHSVFAFSESSTKVHLYKGFNAISWNVFPADNSVVSLFGSPLASEKVKIILDYQNDGVNTPNFNYYIPALGAYNTLQTTDFKKGYIVKLKSDAQPDSLCVSGSRVCNESIIPMNAGLNLFSYLPVEPESTSIVFSAFKFGNLIGGTEYVNNGDGNDSLQFYPGGGFDMMSPSHGYVAGLYTPDTLSFSHILASKSDKKTTISSRSDHSSNSSEVMNAGLPAAIFLYGLNVSIDGNTVLQGTPVQAIDSNHVVCGLSAFIADGVFCLPIYADNPLTGQDEGASPGEEVTIMIGERVLSQHVAWTEFGDTPEMSGELSALGIGDGVSIPKEYALQQNYPNPFNPTTSIHYQLPVNSIVTLKIFDVLGREVATLAQGLQDAGYKRIEWNASTIPSGVYFYRIDAVSVLDANKTFTDIKRMVLLK